MKHIIYSSCVIVLLVITIALMSKNSPRYYQQEQTQTNGNSLSGITYQVSEILGDDTVVVAAAPITLVKQSQVQYVIEPTGVNIRREPSIESEVMFTAEFGRELLVAEYIGPNSSDEWYSVLKGDSIIGYVAKQYISTEQPEHVDTYVGNMGEFRFKSFTDYRSITDTSTPQYTLQFSAYTGRYGIRQVNGRYCVALGSRFNCKVGQYFDIILRDGTILPCIMCDEKDDKHTDETNTYTVHSNCISEFYIESEYMNSESLRTGNLSVIPEFRSSVDTIRVYNISVM